MGGEGGEGADTRLVEIQGHGQLPSSYSAPAKTEHLQLLGSLQDCRGLQLGHVFGSFLHTSGVQICCLYLPLPFATQVHNYAFYVHVYTTHNCTANGLLNGTQAEVCECEPTGTASSETVRTRRTRPT